MYMQGQAMSTKSKPTLGDILRIAEENDALGAKTIGLLPWEIRSVFPHIYFSGGMICFSQDGDSVDREDAVRILELLLAELKPSRAGKKK